MGNSRQVINFDCLFVFRTNLGCAVLPNREFTYQLTDFTFNFTWCIVVTWFFFFIFIGRWCSFVPGGRILLDPGLKAASGTEILTLLPSCVTAMTISFLYRATTPIFLAVNGDTLNLVAIRDGESPLRLP